MRPAIATIDLSAMQHNLQQVSHVAPASKIFAVIKANAYGHGIQHVLPALDQADAFAVACSEEALAIRELEQNKPILLLEGIFESSELDLCIQHNFWIVVHHISQVEMLEKAKLATPLKVWLKIDTGMNRLGFAPTMVSQIWQRLSECANVAPEIGLMTHFANADDPSDNMTSQQLALFDQTVADFQALHSCANSAGVLAWPDSHRNWVRPGIMLYGVSPLLNDDGLKQNLQPVMTLSTRLIAVKSTKQGESIGYGGSWVCHQNQIIGIAAIGYGDGYPRHAPSGTPVLVNNQQTIIVGRVSMDMIAIDLTDQPQATVGDEVILWGNGLPIEQIAEKADTIAYELLCGITSRVHKKIIS